MTILKCKTDSIKNQKNSRDKFELHAFVIKFRGSNLSWNNHIDKITSKANRILGLIKRTCGRFKDVPTLRTLYLALVRSQLEFCSVVWSPYQANNRDFKIHYGEVLLRLLWP